MVRTGPEWSPTPEIPQVCPAGVSRCALQASAGALGPPSASSSGSLAGSCVGSEMDRTCVGPLEREPAQQECCNHLCRRAAAILWFTNYSLVQLANSAKNLKVNLSFPSMGEFVFQGKTPAWLCFAPAAPCGRKVFGQVLESWLRLLPWLHSGPWKSGVIVRLKPPLLMQWAAFSYRPELTLSSVTTKGCYVGAHGWLCLCFPRSEQAPQSRGRGDLIQRLISSAQKKCWQRVIAW